MSTMIAAAIDEAVSELVPLVGARAACTAVGVPRASYYRARRAVNAGGPSAGPSDGSPSPQPAAETVEQSARSPQTQPRALSPEERAEVLEVLHCERFVDAAPATVYATLLDEGRYLCSESTMYRLLRERGETGDRRRQATHPPKIKPELVADAPNRVWSWDL